MKLEPEGVIAVEEKELGTLIGCLCRSGYNLKVEYCGYGLYEIRFVFVGEDEGEVDWVLAEGTED